MSQPRITTLALTLATVACGSYGDPLPPLQLLPPKPPLLTVAQRGTEALLRFDAPPSAVMSADGVLVDLDRIEILALPQRYPAVTADVLALVLDRERRERLEEARTAVEAAEEAAAQRQRDAEMAAAIAAAEAAGEPLPTFPEPIDQEPEEPVEGEELLTEAEIAIRRLPSTVRQLWRGGSITPDTILEAADRLDQAVDDLWDYLGMPTAIVDVNRPPSLPDAIRVVEAAGRVARTRDYETNLDVGLFEEDAEVVGSIPLAQINDYLRGGVVQFSHQVGVPDPGAIRTRYFFALRTVSTRGRESDIDRIVALAPSAVPLPPAAVQATVLASGVLLMWEAPAADLLGVDLDADELEYNVYRLPTAEGPPDATLITPTPLSEAVFLDTAMEWNERHAYEVRAIVRTPTLEDEELALRPAAPVTPAAQPTATAATPPTGPRKESVGVVTDTVRVEDIFTPPAVQGLSAVRAASRVTLRWDEVRIRDLRGYRVYRHAAPAPELPGPLAGLVYPAVAGDDPETDAAGADDAVEAPETDPDAGPARRQLRNRLTTDGWDMLTPVIISENRFIDSLSDGSVEWVYVVEAVDESGNVSLAAAATLPAEEKP